MSEKLLPCPFCDDDEPILSETEIGQALMWSVGCNNLMCAAAGGYWPTQRMALSRWNRRAPSSQAQELAGALEVALKAKQIADADGDFSPLPELDDWATHAEFALSAFRKRMEG